MWKDTEKEPKKPKHIAEPMRSRLNLIDLTL